MFQTPYKRSKCECVEFSSPENSKVEKAGYVPVDVLVRRLSEGGIRLQKAREQFYDSYMHRGPIGDIPIDPTRNGDFDLADATAMSRELAVKASRRKVNAQKVSTVGDTGKQASGATQDQNATNDGINPEDAT